MISHDFYMVVFSVIFVDIFLGFIIFTYVFLSSVFPLLFKPFKNVFLLIFYYFYGCLVVSWIFFFTFIDLFADVFMGYCFDFLFLSNFQIYIFMTF